MESFQQSLTGFGNFAIYFLVCIVFFLVFKLVYTLVTPHNEWKLVKENQNTAAAIGFGGAMIGYAIALSGAASNSVGVIDFAIWGVIGMLAQVMAFLVLRFTFMPLIAERIDNNEISAGVILACVSISIGLFNAACMTY